MYTVYLQLRESIDGKYFLGLEFKNEIVDGFVIGEKSLSEKEIANKLEKLLALVQHRIQNSVLGEISQKMYIEVLQLSSPSIASPREDIKRKPVTDSFNSIEHQKKPLLNSSLENTVQKIFSELERLDKRINEIETRFSVEDKQVPVTKELVTTFSKEKPQPVKDLGHILPTSQLNIIEDSLKLARSHYEERNYRRALIEFEKIIELDDKNLEAISRVAQIHEKLKNHHLAIEYYKQALDLQSDSASLLHGLGNCYRKARKPLFAIESIEQALKIDPENSNYWVDLSLSYRDINQEFKANESLEKAKKLENLSRISLKREKEVETPSLDKIPVQELVQAKQSMEKIKEVIDIAVKDAKASSVAPHVSSDSSQPEESLDIHFGSDEDFTLDTDERNTLLNKAKKLASLNHFDEAHTILQPHLEKYYNDAEFLAFTAECAIRIGENDKAINYLKLILEIDPSNVKAIQAQANIYKHLADNEKAKKLLERAVILEINDSSLWTDLSVIYNRLGEKENANKAIKKAMDLSISSGDFKFKKSAENVIKEKPDTSPSRIEIMQSIRDKKLRELKEKADELQEQNELNDLPEIYRQILKEEPENLEIAYRLLDVLKTMKGDIKEILQLTSKFVEQDKKEFRAFFEHGMALKQHGNLTSAREYLEKARDLNQDATVLKELADIYKIMGQADKASERLGELLGISDKIKITRSAQDLEEQRKKKDSVDFLTMVEILINKNLIAEIDIEKIRSMTEEPDVVPKALLLLGEIYFKVGQYKESIKNHVRYLDFPDPNIHVFKTLGKAYRRVKEFDKAKKLFFKYMEFIPDDAEILMELGVLNNSLKDYTTAIDYYNKAIAANKDNNTGNLAQTYTYRGVSYYNLEDYTSAIDDYEEAIKYNPKKLQSYHNLGIAFEKIHSRDKARESYKKALELAKERKLVNKIRIYEDWIKNV
jgi:tetratricopeptide (TPR) repeat protein